MTRQEWINELLHRMTVAESRGARLYLCAELKREIAALLEEPHEDANEARGDLAVLPRLAEPGARAADL